MNLAAGVTFTFNVLHSAEAELSVSALDGAIARRCAEIS
jgi:hypothetical protein